MGRTTDIEWATHTFNFWWGCWKISPGCKNCYAEALDRRTGGAFWERHGERRLMTEAYYEQPFAWDRHAQETRTSPRVFPSMMDPFEENQFLDQVTPAGNRPPRERMWATIAATPHLNWLLLTKRPEGFKTMLPWYRDGQQVESPWKNVWLGVSVEDSDYLFRAHMLCQTAAEVRFISYEPALGPVDFSQVLRPWPEENQRVVDWIIAGSESGAKARSAELDWYRAVRDQIIAAGAHTAFLLKQHVELDGKRRRKVSLPVLDGVRHAAFPQAAYRSR